MSGGECSSSGEQGGEQADEPDNDFVEIDPTGRYGRYPEVLGKGAFKTVFKAFDELEGIEVAWNQVKVADVLRNADDLERLYSEVHLLKTLKHKNIIKFYNSWVDTKQVHINFITEVFTSGTLRQYRKKHKHVDLRALKNWSRQILSGLLYLHSHDPPVIHRDLKCDNLFVNGNQGEVKIGDLGLAAILRHAQSAHSVIGTPEFMAPELYEEEYNELVDIYAFGMCLLELVTFEYPYVECSNAAQIYKKVTLGIKPASLGKVKDPGVRLFIEKCIANASERLSAKELLMDPFLQSDDNDSINYTFQPDVNHVDNVGHTDPSTSNITNRGIELPFLTGRDFTVEGQRKDINTIFLKLRIADSTGQIRNIHFPFDIEADTSISVATEMVAELDLTDQDVTAIADMIDAEIQAHVPEWVPGLGLDDDHNNEATTSDTHSSEAEDELRALPNEPDQGLGSFVLERLPSGKKYWCDSPRGSNSGSPPANAQSNLSSDLNSHASDEVPTEVLEKDEHCVGVNDRCPSTFSAQRKDPPQFTEDGGNINDEETGCGSQLVNNENEAIAAQHDYENGATAHQHGGDDIHLGKTLAESKSDDIEFIVQKLENLFLEQQNEIDELRKKHGTATSHMLEGVAPELQNKILSMCRLKVPYYSVHKIELDQCAGHSLDMGSFIPAEALATQTSNCPRHNISEES